MNSVGETVNKSNFYMLVSLLKSKWFFTISEIPASKHSSKSYDNPILCSSYQVTIS